MTITDKILTLIAVVALSALASPAQVTTTPYSMYGYGILNDHATSMQRQMGGVGYAMNSGRQINVKNPASYAYCDSLTFLWDVGADISFLHSAEGDLKENSIGGGLDYLTMQFPISKYMGASIGLVPTSSVGYAFGNEIKHGAMENQGSGGLNELYAGVAGRYAGVSLGVNFSYMFGSIVNDVYATPQDSKQTLFEHVMQIRDWNVNIGLQYTLPVTKYDFVTLGVTFQPKKTFLGKTWVTNQNLSDSKQLPDTVAYMKMKDHYYQPNTYGVGLNYRHDRQSHFMVEADFTFQDWSKAQYSPLYSTADPKVMVFEGMKFNNRYRTSLGAEYTNRIRGPYLRRITYRAGGYFSQDYLNIRGNKVKEFGLSCGLGFPTADGKTLINLGFDWKHRQASPQKLISENYFNITLGVNFNEVWFWQRKIK